MFINVRDLKREVEFKFSPLEMANLRNSLDIIEVLQEFMGNQEISAITSDDTGEVITEEMLCSILSVLDGLINSGEKWREV